MRAITILLLAAGLTALPLTACAGHDHDLHFSGDTGFDVEGDMLVITHDSRRAHDEVRISAEGDLTINGEAVAVSRGDRKLLRRFFKEARELEEMAEAVAADAERIAARSTAFAAATVAAVLKSLGDEDAAEHDLDAVEADFEADVEQIEEFAEEIGDRAEKFSELADELTERIPELDDLGWFLDD